MPAKRSSSVATLLLDWYDANARSLPWRSTPGSNAPDPYRVWLSEIMLQQTTVATVRPRFAEFVTRWPNVESLAAASDADLMAAWAGLGYYARARNLIACARIVVAEHGGRFPDTEVALRALPGIGDYTAAAIAAIAFGRRAVAVDANVARVVSRLNAVGTPLPGAMAAIRDAADTITPDSRAGDFAQAMMDLGSGICTSRNPRCLLCPLVGLCRAHATGDPAHFPVKAPKAVRPHRYGTVFWAERNGTVLLMRRPDSGLLGGMRALPTGPWTDSPPGLTGAPEGQDWRLVEGQVSHGFTHFTLDLALAVGTALPHAQGEWWAIDDIESAGMPTVFAKAAMTIRRARCD